MPDEEERTTPEENIFNRLTDALTFHPASVSLFTPDWTLEPGDVVKVLSGEEEYDVPIFTMDLAWNGAVKTDVQSTGNQERQPLSALRRQEYQNARRGYGATRKLEEDVEETVQQYQHFTEENEVYRRSVYKIMGVTYDEHGNVIYQRDSVTGELILDEAGNPIPVYDENSNGSITGQVLQTAQNYTSLYQMTLNAPEFDKTATYQIGDMVMHGGVVYKFTAVHTGDWTGLDVAVVPPLQSQITQNAQEISQKVSSGDLAGYLTITAAQSKLGNVIEWEDGSLKVAEVVTSINTYTGDTTVKIKGDKIELDGVAIISAINGATQPDPEGGGEQTVLAINADKITLNGEDIIAALNAMEGSLTPYGVTAYEVDSAEFGIWDPTSNDVTTLGLRTVSIGPGTSSIDPESGETIYSGKRIKFLADTTFSQATSITYADFPHYHTLTVENGVLTLGDVVSTDAQEPGNTVTLPSALITDVSVGDNILTITKADGTEVNFSKATTLTGGWGSGDTGPNGLFTVSATQTNLNTTTNETEPTEVDSYSFKFNGTSGTADAVFDVELGTITASNLGNSYGTVPIYIGTYTESGTMTHQVELNRTTLISSELRNAWTQSGFDTGYAAGQANAEAAIYNGEITYARNDTQYAASKLFVDVSAFPALLLTDTAEPPNTTTTVGSKVTDTINIPVTVTAATLTSTYANGTYTVTKASGGKVSVDGADIDVGVTSYPISATSAITDGRNSVEVGTASLNDPVSVTDTTQAHDKKYTISGTVQLNYQSGVDGSGNPVYTNIGNPVTITEKNITGVYNTGWTDGSGAMGVTGSWGTGSNANVFTYSATESTTKNGTLTINTGGVAVTSEWDPVNSVYNITGTSAFAVNSRTFNQTQYHDTLTPTAAIAAGWTAAHDSVSVPTTKQTANGYINISVPSSTVGGTANSYTYSLDADDEHVYLKRTGVTPNVIVAQMNNPGGGSAQITAITADEIQGTSYPFVESIWLTASGTNLSDYSKSVQLSSTTISGGNFDGEHCVELILDSKAVGRISVENLFAAGQSSVNIVGPEWNENISSNYPYIATGSVHKDAGVADYVNMTLYLTEDQSWDNSSKKKVYIRPENSSANPIAELEVDGSSLIGMATSNALTVVSQTDAQWSQLSGVTDVTIESGGKYLITAKPKYGPSVQRKFIAPGGSSLRTATGLSDTIVLSPSDIDTVSITDNVVLYDDDSETPNFPVSIDASAVYLAGQQASQAGNIDVVKGRWTVDGTGYLCEFSPASGTGASKFARIVTKPYIPFAQGTTLSNTGAVDLMDTYGSSYVGSQTLYLKQYSSYAYICSNNNQPNLSTNVLARIRLEGAIYETPRSVASLGKVTLGTNDIGTSVSKSTLVTYDDTPPDQEYKNIEIDASAVYARGRTDGASSGSQPIQTYRYTSNNTYHILPTAPYGTMIGADVVVEVPRRNAEGLTQKITLAGADIGQNVTKAVTVGYDEGPDSIMNVTIDASAVYQAGVTEGTGGTYELTTVILQGTEKKFKSVYRYKSGDSFYDRGTQTPAYISNANGSYTLLGDAVTVMVQNELLYKKDSSGNYVQVTRNKGNWFYTTGSTNTLYKPSDTHLQSITLYYGDGGRKTAIGDYDPCLIEDETGSVSYYSAGQTVTDTYYIKQ